MIPQRNKNTIYLKFCSPDILLCDSYTDFSILCHFRKYTTHNIWLMNNLSERSISVFTLIALWAHWFDSAVVTLYKSVWWFGGYFIYLSVKRAIYVETLIHRFKHEMLQWSWVWGSLLFSRHSQIDHRSPWGYRQLNMRCEYTQTTHIFLALLKQTPVVGVCDGACFICDWQNFMTMKGNKWPESVYLSSISYSHPPPQNFHITPE